jgi:hypothetical protein
VLDSFDTLALKDDFTGIAALPADKLFFVQLADAPLMASDVLCGPGIFGTFPDKAISTSSDFYGRRWLPAIAVRFRWKSSTTSSERLQHA